MPLGGPGTAVAGGSGWLEGIMGCFKPVWAIMGKNKPTDAERGEDTAQHYIDMLMLNWCHVDVTFLGFSNTCDMR